MKKIISLFLIYFSLALPALAADPYNNVVFFGDSLTDNGNFFKKTFGLIPHSPPYYNGRFSNGPVWSDFFTDYFKQGNITTENYAVGGETAIFHSPFEGFLPITLSDSIGKYNLDHVFQSRAQTLFILWIGANDYLNGAADLESATNAVIHHLQIKLVELIHAGSKNLLVINLPDMAVTPWGNESKITPQLHDLTLMHNAKLANMVQQLQKDYPTVNSHLFSAYDIFIDVVRDINVFNAKYGTHFNDISTSCWTGGYRLQKSESSANQLRRFLSQTSFAKQSSNINSLATDINHNPSLNEAMQVSLSATSGVKPCENPNAHVFWDHIHPSADVHRVFFQVVRDYINANYSQA